MTRMRRSAWMLGETWHPVMLWYAKAIRRMQQRPITDRTSWYYLAAIHGFNADRWRAVGRSVDGQTLPPQSERDAVWGPCQHMTWYFLPWHRAYLAAFEQIVAAAVVELGGPADWALPYWNPAGRTNPNSASVPAAFTERTMPDGTPNPLFDSFRFRSAVDGNANRMGLEQALRDPDFIGNSSETTGGFGGPRSDTSSGAGASGLCESRPHNTVHSIIGGTSPDGVRGTLADTATAGLDPIFWVHHANIDRLWEVWMRRSPVNRNPDDARWRDGPIDLSFIMPDVQGQLQRFRPGDMVDISAPHLDYAYEDVSDPVPAGMRGSLFASAPLLEGAEDEIVRTNELIGASETMVRVGAAGLSPAVRVDPAAGERMAEASILESTGEPDRLFLNLENIVSDNDAVVLNVYVGLAPDADPEQHPDHLAGQISLFGISDMIDADAGHGGSGLTEVIEITDIVDRLKLSGDLDPAKLGVRIVPVDHLREGEEITIGRISIFRNAEG